jgi:hypothetical protein
MSGKLRISLIQTQLFHCHREERRRFLACHCEERSDEAISTFFPMRLPRCARNCGLPRPFRARNDIVKIYIAFILVYPNQANVGNRTDL